MSHLSSHRDLSAALVARAAESAVNRRYRGNPSLSALSSDARPRDATPRAAPLPPASTNALVRLNLDIVSTNFYFSASISKYRISGIFNTVS